MQELESQPSMTSQCSKISQTNIDRVESPILSARPSPNIPHASGDLATQAEFEFPDELPLDDSKEPNLRDLYLKGETYTLAMVVEEVLAGISLFGGKANKYKTCIKRIQALSETVAPATKQMSEWDDSDNDHVKKDGGKQKASKSKQKRLTKHAEKLFSEMKEEGEKLLCSVCQFYLHLLLKRYSSVLTSLNGHTAPLSAQASREIRCDASQQYRTPPECLRHNLLGGQL